MNAGDFEGTSTVLVDMAQVFCVHQLSYLYYVEMFYILILATKMGIFICLLKILLILDISFLRIEV